MARLRILRFRLRQCRDCAVGIRLIRYRIIVPIIAIIYRYTADGDGLTRAYILRVKYLSPAAYRVTDIQRAGSNRQFCPVGIDCPVIFTAIVLDRNGQIGAVNLTFPRGGVGNTIVARLVTSQGHVAIVNLLIRSGVLVSVGGTCADADLAGVNGFHAVQCACTCRSARCTVIGLGYIGKSCSNGLGDDYACSRGNRSNDIVACFVPAQSHIGIVNLLVCSGVLVSIGSTCADADFATVNIFHAIQCTCTCRGARSAVISLGNIGKVDRQGLRRDDAIRIRHIGNIVVIGIACAVADRYLADSNVLTRAYILRVKYLSPATYGVTSIQCPRSDL